ncbi:hypothetical protein [Chitinilyticum litopenaei]|uniref:hypothetical protein n=1 Tax=Chitinilyticum litopenaei TaxID=1121276 RepID=UPI0004272FB7|nr:hypothetical protein [Chitinilyticum litopenaei]
MDHSPLSPHGIQAKVATPDFSLVLGGPLFQLWLRSRLSDDAEGLLKRRIVVIALLAWLPLVLISAISGDALGGAIAVPFLLDAEVHVRFLLAIPVLVAAELLVHLRLRRVMQQFLDRGLIADTDLPRFQAAIDAAMPLRNSPRAELLLIAIVYAVGLFIWHTFVVLDTSTWYARPGADGMQFTAAGWWYVLVSLPIFQFLLLRWYFRMFIWARLLWRIARLPLRLLPTHADRLGGLGFISGTFYAFTPLAVAHGAMLAAMLANRIFYGGAALLDFKLEILLMVVFMELLVLGPLLFFTPQLAQAKRDGNREYGVLVMRHNREFDDKWLRGGLPDDAEKIGNQDMSSLVDLGSSYDVVRGMRTVPVSRDAILFLAAATVAPLIPLLLTMMSAEELLRKLAGMLF